MSSSPVVDKICSLFIPLHPQPDSLLWGLTSDGEYSVKSGSRLAQGLLRDSLNPVDYAWIWKLAVPPKVKFFLWKGCNDGLPSKSRLERCHVFLPQNCPFCNFHSESINHLCFACPFVIDTFAKLNADFGWPDPPVLSHLLDQPFNLIINHYKSMVPIDVFCQTAIGWWFIWYFRNQVIFQNASVSFSAAALVINNFVTGWIRSLGENLFGGEVSGSARKAAGKPARRGDSVILGLPSCWVC